MVIVWPSIWLEVKKQFWNLKDKSENIYLKLAYYYILYIVIVGKKNFFFFENYYELCCLCYNAVLSTVYPILKLCARHCKHLLLKHYWCIKGFVLCFFIWIFNQFFVYLSSHFTNNCLCHLVMSMKWFQH